MNASDKMKKTNIINKKNRPPKNKGKKTTITFSEASRKDFLTGFRKRKNERRKKAKEQLEKEYKEEVRKAKQKARDDVVNAKSTGASHQILPEIEHLIKGDVVSESKTEDYGTHMVSVTHLNGFGRAESPIDKDSGDDASEYTKDEDQGYRKGTSYHLAKADMKNINRLATKKISKIKGFSQVKKQSDNTSGKSKAGQKANKLQKKFSKKRLESKRTKHYNPRNKTHKKNKDK